MSTEAAIDTLINTLRNLSSSYRNEATSLIENADRAAEAARTPASERLKYDVNRALPPFVRVPLPPTLPGVSDLMLPIADELQDISSINNKFSDEPPNLKWPNFNYTTISPPAEFTTAVPKIAELTIKPEVPELEDELNIPETTQPENITVDSWSGEVPNVNLPTFPVFSGNFYNEYINGLTLVSGDITKWMAYVDEIRATFAPIESELWTRLQGILTGAEPGLPDSWEAQSYEQIQQEAYNQRYTGIDELDSSRSSITGIPSGSKDYARLKLEVQTLQALAEAASKITNARQEREVQHLQKALEITSRLIDAAFSLWAQEVSWRMQGISLALDGAQETLNVSIKVLESKEKELNLVIRYNEMQVQRVDLKIKIEKTKLEKLRIQVANNKLKITYNQNQAEIDEVATAYVETHIQLYETQIDYLLTDQEWRKLGFAAFEAEVLAYKARVNATQAEHAALRARIKGDMAKADAELAQAKQYEIEMKAQEVNARVLLIKTKNLADLIQQKLTGYNTEVSAKINWLKGVDQVVNIAVRALIQSYDAEVQEQMLSMSTQEINDQDRLAKAQREMRNDQLNLVKKLQIHLVQLEQATAQGKVISQGASTVGSIAQTAYSGLNAVGTRELLEEA